MAGGIIRRGKRTTAKAARRITGITTPFGGVQLSDPGPPEREHIRGFLVFLEDRRVLYNPTILEVRSQVDSSIHEIRAECTKVLCELDEGAFAMAPIRAIRAGCRRFHDDANIEFRRFETWPDGPDRNAGFFTALGALRATVGQQVAMLSVHYDIDVEGDLASVLPQLDDGRL